MISTRGPLDRPVIETLRDLIDAHTDEPYAQCKWFINWEWMDRAVQAMEKGLDTPTLP